jgi:hypothetical protein
MDIEQRIEALLDQLMDPKATVTDIEKIEAKVRILRRLQQ